MSKRFSKKQYLLFAFPYPSGSGLHVGHVESMTALDIVARYYRMLGEDVFFPIGWDAFGLPAENYAIKTGVHPQQTTSNAIKTFKRQIREVGISYDWKNELSTCDPSYYHWTQWLFLQLFKKDLAYRDQGQVNWCPSCQTVLANEQVVEGLCERCETEVIQKDLEQWYFRITKYRDELISGLDQVDWPHATKQQQLNWIGKKEGIDIEYQVDKSSETITCFTTTPVNYGASFIVVAPEYSGVEKLIKGSQRDEVQLYIKKAKKKSQLERVRSNEKTGVFTGSCAVNHVTNERIPIWISDFILADVGTGAVQGCPGHDLRDFEFAQKFDLPIPRVVVGPDGDESPITKPEQVIGKGMPGKMVNSEFLNGVEFSEAMKMTKDYFVKKGWGKRVTTYKLRDWLISRQRYWGAPIPIVYDPDGQPHPVKEEHLPWKLADDVDFKPTGESPLKSSKELQSRTEKYASQYYQELITKKGWDKSGKGWRPESDTMDTFVDSSWYYLRYTDSSNDQEFASPENLKKWLPVDFYMIGPEHIVLHLLYSRFFTKFLRDEGYLDFDEPFLKMRHQGMILGPDGKKMSKSKGNVISPDDVIKKFGPDTLRMYEMFMGPIEADKAWNTNAVAGVYRFLERVKKLVGQSKEVEVRGDKDSTQLTRKLHQTIKKVTQDIPKLKFNTAIAALMKFVNEWESGSSSAGGGQLSREEVLGFLGLLTPFAPFMTQELGRELKDEKFDIHKSDWPKWEPELAREEEITIPVQVNGKVRGELKIPQGELDNQSSIIGQAKKLPRVEKWLENKKLVKEIYVPGKIVNLVVK